MMLHDLRPHKNIIASRSRNVTFDRSNAILGDLRTREPWTNQGLRVRSAPRTRAIRVVRNFTVCPADAFAGREARSRHARTLRTENAEA